MEWSLDITPGAKVPGGGGALLCLGISNPLPHSSQAASSTTFCSPGQGKGTSRGSAWRWRRRICSGCRVYQEVPLPRRIKRRWQRWQPGGNGGGGEREKTGNGKRIARKERKDGSESKAHLVETGSKRRGDRMGGREGKAKRGEKIAWGTSRNVAFAPGPTAPMLKPALASLLKTSKCSNICSFWMLP